MDKFGINNVRGGEFLKGGEYDESQVQPGKTEISYQNETRNKDELFDLQRSIEEYNTSTRDMSKYCLSVSFFMYTMLLIWYLLFK